VKENISSTRAVVDDAGDVVEAYDYYPFGLQSRSYKEKGDPLTKETFTGKEQDTESNLHYYAARFYDPSLGCQHRFIFSGFHRFKISAFSC
jgi:RHS repeat-associated protein